MGNKVAWVLFNLSQISSDMTFPKSTLETNTKLPGKETRLSTHIDRILSYTSFPVKKNNNKTQHIHNEL